MNILVTGAAGFIGFHYINNKLNKSRKIKIIGVDNLNNYYDVKLKNERLKILKKKFPKNFKFIKISVNNKKFNNVFKKYKFNKVVHLAAQAGVRLSINKPKFYIRNNIEGFCNILENCRKFNIKNLIYASSSSVYGDNKKIPFNENDRVDNQASIYAVTKKTNELMAKVYNKFYHLNILGIRFFTVYGPLGRPDMFYFKASNKILNKKILEIYNNGNHLRDFTYIDDAINAVEKLEKHFKNKKNYCLVYNVANGKKVKLGYFLNEIEKNLKMKAKLKYIEKQKGDVFATSANIYKIKKLGYKPKTNVITGIKKFIRWFLSFENNEKKIK